MATATYEPLATTTLGADATTITFSSISSSYTDLRVIIKCVGSGTNTYPAIRFNSDTGGNYHYRWMLGDGSTTSSNYSDPSQTFIYTGPVSSSVSSTYGALITVDIFSYAGSKYKTILCTASSDQNGSGEVDRRVGIYLSTTAISTVNLIIGTGGKYGSGTTATLYGIKAA